MIETILTTIGSALMPVLADGLRAIFAKLTGIGGAEPKNIDEAIKLMQAQTERLRALAELDNPYGEVSKWVANLRGAFRYILGALILMFSAIYVIIVPLIAPQAYKVDIANYLLALTSIVFGFFFGDRVYLHLRNK